MLISSDLIFFTDMEKIFNDLFDGEKDLLKIDFPHLKTSKVKFLAYSGIHVLLNSPKNTLSVLSVERHILAIPFEGVISDDLKVNVLLPEKVITPKVIWLVDDLIKLCKSHYCETINYRSIDTNGVNSFELKEFHIQYNCIAWALGIHDWIDPIQYIGNVNDLSLLKNKTENFLYYVSLKYNTPEKDSTVIFDIIDNIDRVVCTVDYNSRKHLINIDGAVAFYFDKKGMTHAARYIKEFKGKEVNTWSSKLGHNLMVAHELDDLSGDGSLYGDPLCYGIPFSGLVGEGKEL